MAAAETTDSTLEPPRRRSAFVIPDFALSAILCLRAGGLRDAGTVGYFLTFLSNGST